MLVKRAKIAAACALLVVSSAGWLPGDDQTTEPTSVTSTNNELSAKKRAQTPVDRLKARSSQQRWQRLSQSKQRSKTVGKSVHKNSDDAQWQRVKSPSAVELVDSIETRYADETADETFSNNAPPVLKRPARFREFQTQNESSEFSAVPPSQAVAAQTDENDIYLEIEKEFPRLPIGTEFQETDIPTEDEQFLSEDVVETNDLAPREELPITNDYQSNNEAPAYVESPPVEAMPQQRGTTRLAQREILGVEDETRTIKPLIQSPKDLKPLSEIQPFFDYEPDPKVRKKDPYLNVFPRPADAPSEDPNLIYPDVVDLGDDVYQPREIAHVDYPWLASDVYHYPLYFEDTDFERYGHTHHDWVQPFASLGTFGVQLIGLPYQMALDPICKRQYTLGWYRPGECAPYTYYQIPWNTKAAVTSGLFYTGMVYAFP